MPVNVVVPFGPTSRSATGSRVPAYGCEPCCSTQKPIVYDLPGSNFAGTGSSTVDAQPPACAGAAPTTAPTVPAQRTRSRAATARISLIVAHLHQVDTAAAEE